MALVSKTAGWLPITILGLAASPFGGVKQQIPGGVKQQIPGGVKLQIREGRPVVDGIYVNGHGPFLFLIDTGTNVNLIETRLAKSIGMNAAFHVDFASSAGKVLLPGSDGNEVQLLTR